MVTYQRGSLVRTSLCRMDSVTKMWRWLLPLVFLTGTGCGDQGGVVSPPATAEAEVSSPEIDSTTSTTAVETTTPSTTSVDSTTLPEPVAEEAEPAGNSDETEAGWEVSTLRGIVNDTIAIERMSFELESVSSVGEDEIVFKRTGWFDDDTYQATGTMLHPWTEGPETVSEFRMVDGEYWAYDPFVETWSGWELSDVLGLMGENPIQSMDGDRSLFQVMNAVTSINSVEEQPDGTTLVSANATADDLLLVFTEATAAERLAEAGGSSTTLSTVVTFTVADGVVTAIHADLSAWWEHVSGELLQQGGFDPATESASAGLRITYMPYTEPRNGERPCADSTIETVGGLTTYGC